MKSRMLLKGQRLGVAGLILTIITFLLLSGSASANNLTPLDGSIESDERQPASLFLGEARDINLDDVQAVFTYVFSKLNDEVTVYPTENYLYFRFFAGPKYIWGNVRLSPEDRDKGLVHFAYYEFKEDLTGPEDANARYKVMGPTDEVTIKKHNDFRYSLTYNGKTVTFVLNQLEQIPPRSFTLPPDEEMLFRLHDESNIRFFLLFNRKTHSFMYVADEDNGPLKGIMVISDDLVVDKVSGFAFYVDAENNDRKILMGVRGKNIRQNNYYDGPFDQLADNYIGDGSKLAEYVQLAYPHTRGRVNKYAVFTDVPNTRLAILPYYSYDSVDQLSQLIASCRVKEIAEHFYRCIAHDYQQPSGEVVESTKSEPASELSLPAGTPHEMGSTYVHRTGLTWIPPGTPHEPPIQIYLPLIHK